MGEESVIDGVSYLRCDWCGTPYRPNSTGRQARYCRRSCRQRAYEARLTRREVATALARHGVRVPAAAPVPPVEPAMALPAVAVACPACGAPAGQLCTSHSGTRVRRHDVHQRRTAAHRAAQEQPETPPATNSSRGESPAGDPLGPQLEGAESPPLW